MEEKKIEKGILILFKLDFPWEHTVWGQATENIAFLLSSLNLFYLPKKNPSLLLPTHILVSRSSEKVHALSLKVRSCLSDSR